MKTIFPCNETKDLLSSVHQRRVPARPTSSVPSRTKLGAEDCPPRLRLFLATALAAFAIGLLSPVPAATGEPVRIVAMGDVPYRVPEDYGRFERLIAAVNREHPALVIHIGDIKSGSTPCTDARYLRIRDYFATVDAPLVYTPGDNEWTDCHRPAAGSMDPIERLASLRSLFFAPPRQLGGRPLAAVRQSDPPGALPYPENIRAVIGGVVVIAAHVVGSNNDLRHGHPAEIAEYEARDRATAAWIRAGFEAAREAGAPAVILAMHADLFARGNGLPAASNRSGFAGTLTALAEGATRFGGPVLVVHGDGHRYQVDRPFLDGAARPLANVTRVEVFGAPTVAAVMITIGADGDRPFDIRPLRAPEPDPDAERR